MTRISAKFPDAPLVVFVVYPGIVLLDLAGPLQVFSHARSPSGGPGYRCLVVSDHQSPLPTNTVASITTQSEAQTGQDPIHTMIVVGGTETANQDPALVALVQRLARRAGRVASVCSGALVLAAAGLLDGRRAVTHWEDCATLAHNFPKVRVEEDPIYIQDGPIWTSAGITAGIDMALAMVADDYGPATALQMARQMVTQRIRTGGQSQFNPGLSQQFADGSAQFSELHAWISRNLTAPLTVEDLAEKAHMSPRNFARVYARATGTTPAKAVEALRTEAARDLLESSDQSLKAIAATCGFGDENRMRRAFLRHLSVTPASYRQTFQTPGSG